MKIFLVAVALVISVPALAEDMFPGDTYRESFENALADNWRKYGRSPGADRDFYDCLVNEVVGTFTIGELGRLDVYADTRNPDLIPEMNAIVANRDRRVNGDLLHYVTPRCEHLAN